jgi:hypothetical protein
VETKPVITDAPAPGSTRGWTLAVIGCEKEGVTLDACLIFAPPHTPIEEILRIGGEAGIPHPYLRSAIVLGPDFDPDDYNVDTMFAYTG